VKLHTVFLRNECILPDRFDLRQELFCKGWAEATGSLATELDARVRGVGWHFMWMMDSYLSHGAGRTRETAIHSALIRALKEVKGQFNAAELGSIQITGCLGLQLAKVTLHARHIQKQASIDSSAEFRLQQVLAH
jgi:hypothetical protein